MGKFLMNIKAWFEVRKEWKKLLRTGSFYPGRKIKEFLDKRDELEAITGLCFSYPSLIIPINPLCERIIKNKIKEELTEIKSECREGYSGKAFQRLLKLVFCDQPDISYYDPREIADIMEMIWKVPYNSRFHVKNSEKIEAVMQKFSLDW